MEYEWEEKIVADTKRYIVLVIYDIVDNKRRNKMVASLENMGCAYKNLLLKPILPKNNMKKWNEKLQK